MRKRLAERSLGLALVLAAAAGCADDRMRLQQGATVPLPIDLLLPHSIRVHSFTGTRTFSKEGNLEGVEVRLEALDATGDRTKAFGTFRFELYAYDRHRPENRGAQLAVWDLDLLEPRANLVHFDRVYANYLFKLEWDRPLQVGRRFVLVAVFSSPFTERLTDQREFVAGE